MLRLQARLLQNYFPHVQVLVLKIYLLKALPQFFYVLPSSLMMF
ncbi:hypothetical protein L579_3184 [Pantoea sp. AS-PWVM4]|nr:hypothetical protein L579_3184 [Pantoea sp. AS-PWVM4]